MRRADRHAQVKALKDSGLTFKEIAAHLGLSKSTITSAYYDPTGEIDRARKERYTGTCAQCGGRTNNGGAACGPPDVCKACAQPEWTADAVLLALHEFGDANGGIPPRERDAKTGGAGHGALPHSHIVARHFGSWNAGLLAAGFDALHCDRRPETQHAIETAIRAGESTQSVADRHGVSVQAIYQRFVYRGSSVGEARRAA